jgi:hypothetical protein
LDDNVAGALREGGIADITTTGRKSGNPSRIEIVFLNLDGEFYITGRPGPRDWMANLLADPRFTLHLKRGLTADLAAAAELITDDPRREPVLYRILTEGFRVDPDEATRRMPIWLDSAPLIRFTVKG